MIEKKTPAQAWKITPDDIADSLETLSEESYHCAELAAGALYQALTRYQTINQNPWKKSYMNK
jgi:nitrogen fixation protein NifU and related proteins